MAVSGKGFPWRLTLYGLFFMSGTAGLIYESLWSRYLGLFVGHAAYAQILVLVIFMGGLALGALAVGRRTEKLKKPLLGYALVELVVAVLGLTFHWWFQVVTGWAYASVLPGMSGATLQTVKWLLAASMILPQAFLLGTTFPLMSAGFLRRAPGEPGRALSLLYFTNSLGAAGGGLLAGFLLIPVWGLPGALLVASAINLVVALGAAGVDRAVPDPGKPIMAEAVPALQTPDEQGPPGRLLKVLLAVAMLTASASFIYEIAWIRMLALVLGSATHAFELMLSAFILGLALGAFWLRGRLDTLADPLRTLGWVQWAMGACALATLPLYLFSFRIMNFMTWDFPRTDTGYLGYNLIRYGLCLMVMLPSTFCAGMTLPLITRVLLVRKSGEKAIGQVYGLNTLGSIFGAFVAGMLLLPLLGLKGTLLVGAGLDMLLGALVFVMLMARSEARRLAGTAVTACVALVVLALFLVPWDPGLLTSGVYRVHGVDLNQPKEVLYYQDGRTATVATLRYLNSGTTLITTNGKADGSLHKDWHRDKAGGPATPLSGDDGGQVVLPLVAMMHHPKLRNVAVVGQGTGVSSSLYLGLGDLQELVTVEIEPAMLEGSRVFSPFSDPVFEDPRSRVVLDDARSFFASSADRYDLILSEPSNVWVSGVSDLFTVEFYEQLTGKLNPGGLVVQWIHLYEINDQLILDVLRTFEEVFPHWDVYYADGTNIIIVASMDPLPEPDPEFARDALPRIPFPVSFSREQVEALHLGSRRVLGPLVREQGRINSAFDPVLDSGSERPRFFNRKATGFTGLHTRRFSPAAALEGRTLQAGTDLVPLTSSVQRANMRVHGAGLRTLMAGTTLPPSTPDILAQQQAAAERLRAFQTSLQSPPANWNAWLSRALQTEADLHVGTHGWADPQFYGPVLAYMADHQAPKPVEEAMRFMWAVARWETRDILQRGPALESQVLGGRLPLEQEVYVLALAAAMLEDGRPDAALAWLQRHRGLLDSPRNNFTLRLLEAHARVEQGSTPGP